MLNEIILGDCLEAMMYIPDKSVDMILCDLPYGTTACKWDTVIPFKPLWEQYKRIIKDNRAIVLTASQPFTTALGASNIEMLKYAWCWEKSNAGDCMNVKNKPMKKHEDILVFSNGTTANKSERRMLYNPQGLTPCTKKRSGCDYSTTNEHSFKAPRPSHKAYIQEFENYPIDLIYFPNDKNAVHPTQKPVALFEYLIKTYTNEGDTVLDNCIGSGTTAIACLSTKRNFIGIEKEEKYWKIAIDRIEKHKLNMIPNISFRNKEFMERQ